MCRISHCRCVGKWEFPAAVITLQVLISLSVGKERVLSNNMEEPNYILGLTYKPLSHTEPHHIGNGCSKILLYTPIYEVKAAFS